MKRIAVYGSLRKGEYNHRGEFAREATHIADGIIYNAELVGGNAYPWIVPAGDDSHVVVEVYDFPDNVFQWIEAMEVGAGYERRSVKVHHFDEDDEVAMITDAEAYFYANPDELAKLPRIASGDWSKRDEQ
jgi:gamma-glutamylcyclotransferase (GGCT)/AIG2-like uncharacterized protein YtfP